MGVEDGCFEQEGDKRLCAVLSAEFAEGGEFGEVGLALDLEDGVEGVWAELGGGEQFEEEVVSVAALADERGLEPAGQFSRPARG